MPGIDPRLRAATARARPTAKVPQVRLDVPGPSVPHVRPDVVGRPDVAGRPDGPEESLPRVTLLRPGDLLRLELSFVNLVRTVEDGVPFLVRQDHGAPGYLVVGLGPQHLAEEAFYDASGPADAFRLSPPDGSNPAGGTETPHYPVQARLARSSRVVHLVEDERIVYTETGLLHAMRVLPLSVVRHAEASGPLRPRVPHVLLTPASLAGQPAGQPVGLPADLPAGPRVTRLAETARALRTSATLGQRFGTSVDAATTTHRRHALDLDLSPTFDLRPPVPYEPEPTDTALEVPWRLQLSPHGRGAFMHALGEVEHDGRVELWHSRLGVRTSAPADLDPTAPPPVDETDTTQRTVSAVWTRDFTPGHGPEQRAAALPAEDLGDPATLLPFRSTLTAGERMQLVHLTSNHRFPGVTPHPARVEHLMLTAAGAWLTLDAQLDPGHGTGLSILEWQHRATLGRDHFVRVVRAGILLPFGHEASLVKVTERRVTDDGHATLYQRLYVVVREPEKTYGTSGTATLDHQMPWTSVRILTRSTPPLARPRALTTSAGGQVFVPEIADVHGAVGTTPAPDQTPFHFRMLARDVTHRLVELSGPLIFVERSALADDARRATVLAATRAAEPEYPLLGQRVGYAPPADPDDTTLATTSMVFDAEPDPGGDGILPVLRLARAPVPAMAAFTGDATPLTLRYARAYAAHGFGGPTGAGNQAELFLELLAPDGTPVPPGAKGRTMGFASQSDRSGGFVSPSVEVRALARRVGPVGGNLTTLANDRASFDVGTMFDLSSAKLFGLLPLAELLPVRGGTMPAFVTQTVDSVVGLGQAVDAAETFLTTHAGVLAGAGATVVAEADALRDAGQRLVDEIGQVVGHRPGPRVDLAALLGDVGTHATALRDALRSARTAAPLPLPRPALESALGVLDRLASAATDAAALAGAIGDLARGSLLPERVSAQLAWETPLEPWPRGSADPVFEPRGDGMLRLVSEVQAPLRDGPPTALVSCSLPPFTLNLVGASKFLEIHVDVMELSVQPGRKPDVDVRLSDGQDGRPDALVFCGPLRFVETLKDIIPFDGFSDPPYVDIEPSGLRAGFDLEVPDLAVGIFALTNIHVGAELVVPFIGESLELRLFFATRENPFRLQVAFFAGGGFFAMTVTPGGLRVIEAAFEFGAAVAMSFVVASGSLSVMAGIYFRLEIDKGAQSVQLTGYFRARGEVDVLGLVSAAIELYLELSYREITGPGGASVSKAVGKASISIEVSVCFLSFSVSVSCEKQFAGSQGDPTFLDTMGPYVDEVGAARDPWAEYCGAFAAEAV